VQQRHRLLVLRPRQRHPSRRQQPNLTSRVLLRQSSSGRQRSQTERTAGGPARPNPPATEMPFRPPKSDSGRNDHLHRHALLTPERSQATSRISTTRALPSFRVGAMSAARQCPVSHALRGPLSPRATTSPWPAPPTEVTPVGEDGDQVCGTGDGG